MANLIKNILGLVVGILLPWILIFLFMIVLTDIDINWFVQLPGGFLHILSVLTFESIGFAYTAIIFGYGFIIPLAIWLITGLICGLITKSVLKAIVFPLIGLGVTIVLFFILSTAYPIPTELIAATLTPLFQGFSVDMILSLILHLVWYSLILPSAILGGLIGGIIARYRL